MKEFTPSTQVEHTEQNIGMPNGVMHYTDATADAMRIHLRLVLSTGGDVAKSIDAATVITKLAARALVKEDLGNLSGSEFTHHLASLPKVPELHHAKPAAVTGTCADAIESLFEEINT
ncbi:MULTISPECIES: hypothetical protein [Pseudomonas]|jgi:hypothetical protein|uniref:hypothetical protein n=1 Tax=Pseudomonadaceae TaxID=135621 RepID=UPI000480D68D|nr:MULTISPECIES: hypothetical protein [Pseudomonas]AZC15608.1 hypothetical protein C4K40_0183 [Pseudomonas sp. CMR5c]